VVVLSVQGVNATRHRENETEKMTYPQTLQSAEQFKAEKSLQWEAVNGRDDSADDADDTRLDEFKDSSGRIDWEAVYDSGICDPDTDCDDDADLLDLLDCDDSIGCDDDVAF
jgi:hypothetical protein